MNTITSCNVAPISVFIPSSSNPWNVDKVKHMYRRLAYGAPLTTINTALQKTPSDLVDEVMDEALTAPLIPAPDWISLTYNDYPNQEAFDDAIQQQVQDLKYQFTVDLLNTGLKGRLILFWMNHFVTQQEVYYCSGQLFRYYDVLQRYALGNFKDFTHAIGITPAMLHYLNGFDNTKAEPNENYARELYELFTLGENNGYTQQDIEETSRALTGYNSQSDFCGEIFFNQWNTFDDTEKTIFGQTGNWGYDDVIDILFEQKQELIATFICKKLYAYFVSPDINSDIVAQMASTFISSGLEIEPVLRQLFKSEHFFDSTTHGTIVKSPIDLTHQFLNETGYPYNEEGINTIQYIHYVLGQDIFQPVDVAGWQRNHDWISSSTLTGRWVMMEWVIYNSLKIELDQGGGQPQFRQFVKDISDNSKDPAVITKAIIDHFMSKKLVSPGDYDIATTVFKGEVPENYYTQGIWDLDYEFAHWQILHLLFHIAKMPEYQLK